MSVRARARALSTVGTEKSIKSTKGLLSKRQKVGTSNYKIMNTVRTKVQSLVARRCSHFMSFGNQTRLHWSPLHNRIIVALYGASFTLFLRLCIYLAAARLI